MIALDSIDYEMQLFGYTTKKDNIKNVLNHDDALEVIRNFKTTNIDYKTSRVPMFMVKRSVQNGAQKLLSNVDLNVHFMKSRIFETCIWPDYSLDKLKEQIREKNVFQIPTHYNDYASISYLSSIFISPSSIPPIVSDINLTRETSESDYIHEIGHALIERNEGIVQNYLHREFGPILLELIYMYLNYGIEETRMQQFIKINNLRDTLACLLLSEKDILDRRKYFTSTLKAFQMFDYFLNSSKLVREEIIIELKNILNGKLVLEDFLDKYEIGFDNDDINNSLRRVITQQKN